MKSAYAHEPHEVYIVDRSKFDRRFLPVEVKARTRRPRSFAMAASMDHLGWSG
jgi:hypothetical protein